MKKALKVLVELVKMHTVEAKSTWALLAVYAVIIGLAIASKFFIAVKIGLAVCFGAIMVAAVALILWVLFHHIKTSIQQAKNRVDSQ